MSGGRAGWAAGVLVSFLVCCVQAPGSFAVDTPSIAAAPASPEMTSVVVTLRGRADLSGVAGRRADRLRDVQSELRATALESQAAILARLRDWQRVGKAGTVRSLWITNSVAVTATPEVVARIAARGDVLAVVPDRIDLVPAAAPATANQEAIQAPQVWAAGHTGQGAVVASLDSGVDASHPDLQPRWRGGTNSWFDPYGQHPTTPTDLTGHGTGVTGVMVGGDDGGSSIGTAPGAAWIAARVFNDAGASTISAVHQAFQWVLDPDQNPATADAPQVVNASWSIGTGPGCDLTFQPDVQALRAANILPVFSAGNFGPTAGSSISPANYPESLSVGAVANSGVISGSSSRGPSTCGGRTRPFPDVVAPGVGIYTTDRYGLYQTVSGTSEAAPHVSGVLALLLGARPGLTAAVQEQLVVGTATDLGPTGVDETYGHGLVDAAAAYAAIPAPEPSFTLTVTPPSASVEAGASATYDVSVVPVNGFTADVDLALSGLPGAAGSASFAPPTITGGAGGSTLTVQTDPGAADATHTLTVTASGGTTTRSADVTLEVTARPAPVDALVFSTVGSVALPGVPGPADDADLYAWSASGLGREADASALGLPAKADVDGFHRVDATHFYVSFAASTTWVPGLGKVQDEDIVYFGDGTWSLRFNGTAHGLRSPGEDIDAFTVKGSRIWFSTRGNVRPPGVGGTADDADVYRWNGHSFKRVWDATRHGLPRSANVDGLVRRGAALYLSFANAGTAVPGLGTVRDEDVVALRGGVWSTYFDGSARGLGGSGALDIDAFDLP